ncbi:MAG: gamma-glutamyltransferase, partial [Gammaproteobacteria bacterium]
MTGFRTQATALVLAGLLAACDGSGGEDGAAGGVPPARQAETARSAARFMVAAADPHAVDAGVAVLRAGGNAMDAAVAVQLVLGFVEFPETGLGGGGFLLYRDGASGRLHVYDGRETAPAAAAPGRVRVLGMPLPWPLAVVSGRAVGVPGLVALLARAHRAHGTRPWAELVLPAAALAARGVPPPPRLVRAAATAPLLRAFGDVDAYFAQTLDATPPRLVNPAYAATLRTLAHDGPAAFYHGPLAGAVVARARARPWLPSDLTRADFAAYRVRERAPLCAPYRGYSVCSIGPPSSGGIALLQMLGMLAHFDLGALAPASPAAVHLLAEASRLAYADRERYVGDPDYVDVPVAALLEPAYLARRAALIDARHARAVAPAG